MPATSMNASSRRHRRCTDRGQLEAVQPHGAGVRARRRRSPAAIERDPHRLPPRRRHAGDLHDAAPAPSVPARRPPPPDLPVAQPATPSACATLTTPSCRSATSSNVLIVDPSAFVRRVGRPDATAGEQSGESVRGTVRRGCHGDRAVGVRADRRSLRLCGGRRGRRSAHKRGGIGRCRGGGRGAARVRRMALPKVCGIETEYGIVVRGAENNPVVGVLAADQRLRRRHHQPAVGPGRVGLRRRAAGQRRPRLQPRRRRSPPRSRPRSSTPCSPTAPATTSTTPTRRSPPPRWPTALEAVRFDRAAEEIVRRSMVHATAKLAAATAPAEVVVYKNNSDGKGNSYGCHENYLLARETPVRAHRRPGHAALRHPPGLHRRRQGRLRAARPADATTCPTS